MAIDPVCAMKVKEEGAIKLEHQGKVVYFCSTHCRDKFMQREHIEAAECCPAASKRPIFSSKLFIVSIAVCLIIITSLFIPSLTPFRKAFFIYVKTIWWAVMLGLLLGGIIDYYIPSEYISKLLSRRGPATIFKAVGLGFLMSACSHGILALSIQLHKKGASNPAVVSFLLASPWANFTITLMLLGFFGLKGLMIIVAAIIIAVNTGFIFMFLEKRGLTEKNKNTIEVASQFSIIQDIRTRAKNYRFNLVTLGKDTTGVIKGVFALSEMVLWWIILGIVIASFAAAYIPTHIFHKFMGPTILGLFVTLALATVIEVCSEGSSPLAFEIYRQTHALGNSFTFLMAGVVTDYTEIGLLWMNVGRRVALWLPLVTVPQVILLGLIFNRLLF
jgi:uncharacterized membrane protein YraQ (UPF0718 family)/YHS domain-containing protein